MCSFAIDLRELLAPGYCIILMRTFATISGAAMPTLVVGVVRPFFYRGPLSLWERARVRAVEREKTFLACVQGGGCTTASVDNGTIGETCDKDLFATTAGYRLVYSLLAAPCRLHRKTSFRPRGRRCRKHPRMADTKRSRDHGLLVFDRIRKPNLAENSCGIFARSTHPRLLCQHFADTAYPDDNNRPSDD